MTQIALLGVSGPTGGAPPPPPSTFVPTDIYGMEAWYYQPDLDYAAGTWTDRSGNARNTSQATAGKRPTLSAALAELNGKYAADFDGGDYIKSGALTLAQPFTLLTLARQDTWNTTILVDLGTAVTQAMLAQHTATPNMGIFAGTWLDQTRNIPVGRYGLWTARFNGASSLIWNDGAQSGAGNAGTNGASGGINIGNRSDEAVSYFDGQFSEIQVYRGILGAYSLVQLWNEWVAADRYNIPVTFNPSSLGGVQAWFRGDDLGAVDSSISSWADQSGNVRNAAQATGSAQPLVKIGVNGRKCAYFDGGDQLRTGAFTVNQPATIMVVAKNNTDGGVYLGDRTSNNFRLYRASATQIQSYAGSGTVATATPGEWSVITATFNGASSILSGDDIESTVNPGAGNMTDGLVMGCQGSGINFMTGYIAEVIIFNFELTTAQRQLMRGYFANKYARNVAIRPFDPLSIPLMSRWYEADLTDQTVDGGVVTTMYDKVGSGLHVTQATAGNKPLYRLTGGPNSRPSIEFDGSNDELLQSPAGAFFSGTPHTYIAVVKNTDLAVVQRAVVGVGAYNASGTQFGIGSGAAGYVGTYLGGVGTLNGVNFQYDTTDYTIIAYRHNPTGPTNHIWADGLVETKAAAGIAAPAASSAIGSGVGGGYWKGHICCVLVANTNLADADIASLLAWLAKRYDISYKAPNHSSLVANLAAWYDASQIVGLSTGAAVSQWNDLSTNAKHLVQATGANQPTYQTLQQNGRPVVRFDTTDILISNANLTLTHGYATIYMVVKAGPGVPYRLLGYGPTSAASGSFSIQDNSATFHWQVRGTSADILSSSTTTPWISDSTWHILAFRIHFTNPTILWKDGVEDSRNTGALGSLSANTLRIGNDGAGSPGNGDFAEIVVCDAYHSNADVRAVTNYLAQKWNKAV